MSGQWKVTRKIIERNLRSFPRTGIFALWNLLCIPLFTQRLFYELPKGILASP
jgi:hypothetical protein